MWQLLSISLSYYKPPFTFIISYSCKTRGLYLLFTVKLPEPFCFWLLHWKQHIQTLVVRLRSALCSSSTLATSSCPSLAAMCRGVYMSLVVESGLAPCCNSRTTLSTLPNLAAIWRGVCCSWEHTRSITQLIYFLVFKEFKWTTVVKLCNSSTSKFVVF